MAEIYARLVSGHALQSYSEEHESGFGEALRCSIRLCHGRDGEHDMYEIARSEIE